MSGRRTLALAGRLAGHALRGQRLRLLTVEVTKRCNARCEFCDYWREPPGPELEDYAPIVRRFAPLVVTFSGGEPLVRRDFAEVVRKVRAADPAVYLSMVTNGALLTLERARELRAAGIDQLSISLDYPDERHDRARGIPGLAARVRGLLGPLAGAGFDAVSLNAVVKNDNLEHIPAIMDLAREAGVHVGFSAYCTIKKAGRDDLLVAGGNRGRLRETVRLIKEAKRRHRITRSSDYYLDRLEEYFAGAGIAGCEAGIRFAQVTPAGRIKPCSELPEVCDWRDYDPRAARPVSCTSCWYSCRGEAQAPVTWRRVRELIG
jgi:MoaA/NifB/PqqE/SkfB family radical SAM enzyme